MQNSGEASDYRALGVLWHTEQMFQAEGDLFVITTGMAPIG
jgi:hypothetical protein